VLRPVQLLAIVATVARVPAAKEHGLLLAVGAPLSPLRVVDRPLLVALCLPPGLLQQVQLLVFKALANFGDGQI